MPSYWTERAEESAKKYYKQGDKSLVRLERMFKVASDTMRNEIILFYAKYGIDKKSPIFGTLTDGTEVMTGSSVKRVVPSHEAHKYARIDSLQKQLNVILIELSREQNKYMLTELKQLAQGAYYNTWFDTFQGYGVGWQFNLLDPKVVKELVTHPVHGQNFSTRVWNNRKLLSNQVNQELRSGITQGISTKEMSKRLSSKMGSGYKVAERLMRTEITNTYNQATLQGYKDSGIVNQYEYLATLDLRTSAICADLDNDVFNINDAVTGLNYPPMHPNCFDKETEVFTDKGWKLFTQLTTKEKFLAINPDNIDEYEWVEAREYVSYKYKGEMVSLKNAHFDMMVTPNHRMLLSYVGKGSADKWRFVEADKIPKWNNKIYRGLTHATNDVKSFKLGDYEIEPTLYLKFMAWYLSDGSTTKIKGKNSYRVKIAQETHNQLMFDVLKELPFNVTQTKGAINIYDYSVGADLSKYGKCIDKFIPKEIKNASKEQIEVFLKAYAIADGHTSKGKEWKGYKFKDHTSFFTTSNRLAADLGESILKVGGRPTFKSKEPTTATFKNGTFTSNYPCWTIKWNTRVNTYVETLETKMVDYDDSVYCVSLEKWETLLTRRNGFIAWSGNCRSTTVAKFDDEIATRRARDEKGNTYLVPSNMTYKEWAKEYL